MYFSERFGFKYWLTKKLFWWVRAYFWITSSPYIVETMGDRKLIGRWYKRWINDADQELNMWYLGKNIAYYKPKNYRKTSR